jgi:hypothetical protein
MNVSFLNFSPLVLILFAMNARALASPCENNCEIFAKKFELSEEVPDLTKFLRGIPKMDTSFTCPNGWELIRKIADPAVSRDSSFVQCLSTTSQVTMEVRFDPRTATFQSYSLLKKETELWRLTRKSSRIPRSEAWCLSQGSPGIKKEPSCIDTPTLEDMSSKYFEPLKFVEAFGPKDFKTKETMNSGESFKIVGLNATTTIVGGNVEFVIGSVNPETKALFVDRTAGLPLEPTPRRREVQKLDGIAWIVGGFLDLEKTRRLESAIRNSFGKGEADLARFLADQEYKPLKTPLKLADFIELEETPAGNPSFSIRLQDRDCPFIEEKRFNCSEAAEYSTRSCHALVIQFNESGSVTSAKPIRKQLDSPSECVR